MLRATITAGNYQDSTAVTVDVTGIATGSLIVISRGEWVIGSATIVSSGAPLSVPVYKLATGDIIQASITERGTGSGIPVRVTENPNAATGWLTPTTIRVTNPDGTTTDYSASSYLTTFGELPADVYNPVTAGLARIPVLYEQDPSLDAVDFDVLITQQAGTTSLTVLARPGDSLLVGWNGATPSTAAPLSITSNASVTVTVRRDTDGLTATRTISATVLPAAGAGASAADIIAVAYRYMTPSYLRFFVNSAKPCQLKVPGLFGSAWKDGTFYDPNYQEMDFASTSPGTYTATIRVTGDTNAAHYATLSITI